MEKKIKTSDSSKKFAEKDAESLIKSAKKSAKGQENASERKFWGAPEVSAEDQKVLSKIQELQGKLAEAKASKDSKIIEYYKNRIETEEDKLKESSEISAKEGVEKIKKINGASEADIKEAQQAGQRLKSSVELAMEKTGGLINKKSVEKTEESEKKPAKDESIEGDLEKNMAAEEKKEQRKEMRESQKELDDARKELAGIDRSDPRYPEVEEKYRLQVDAMKVLMWMAKRDQLEKKEYLDEETGKYKKLSPEEAKERLDKYAGEVIAPHFAVMEAAKIQNLKAEQTFTEKVKDSKFAKFAYGAIDKYRKLPFKQKMLISGGLIAAGIGASAIGGAVGGAVVGAAFLGKWIQRALSSGGTAVAVEALMQGSHQKWMAKEGWGKNRHEFVSKQIDAIRRLVREQELRQTEIEEIGGMEEVRSLLDKRKELENKLEKRRGVIAGAVGLAIGSGAALEAVKNLSHFSGFSDFLAGKVIGTKGMVPWTKEIANAAPEKVAKIGHIELKVGSRGPEGAILNYFDENPLAAKDFGWNGKMDLHKWAGVKAHQLWIDEAHKALADPKTLSQMDMIGYEKNLDGYGQMMRNMGKGIVEIDATAHKIDLVNTEYLKNSIEQLRQYDGAAYIDADEVRLEDVADEVEKKGLDAGDVSIENIQRIMDSSDSKFGRIISKLHGSEQAGLKSTISRMGGWDKFINSPASVLFYREGQETDVFIEKFGLQLKNLTNDSYALHDNITPIKKILESIDSKKIYGGTAEDLFAVKGVVSEKISEEIVAEKVPGSDILDRQVGQEIFAERVKDSPLESAGQMHNEVIAIKTGVKGLFKYSPEGKVQSVSINGGGSILQGQTVLKDNWRVTMLNGGASSLQINAVVGRASTLFQYEELLKSLEQSGKGSSPEAEYLKKRISDIIEPTEKQFGDIFK